MGKSTKITVGYWYALGLHMGLCRGPIDALVEVKVGDKRAFFGSAAPDSTLRISQPNLFGGESKEGGVDGTLAILSGSPTMPRHSGLAAMLGGLVPAFRGVTTVFWDGWVAAMNPYLKSWSFRVRRTTEGWEGGCWHSSKAAIWMENNTIKGMNPAHILYQVYTDSRMGRGLPRAMLDDANWQAAADRLHSEGFGLCMKWTRQDTIEAFAQIVLDHIGGSVYVDRQTGKICLKLIRDDYDPTTLPIFDADSGLLTVEEFESVTLMAAPNEIIVKYVSPIDGKEREVRARNAASLAITGGAVISECRDYPGLPTSALAARVAMRDLKVAAGGIKKCVLKLDRRAAMLVPGDVFRIRSDEVGVSNMVLRAGRIEYGEGTDGTVTVVAVQDVFGLPTTSYHVDEESAYIAPDFTPKPVSASVVFDVPYREILRMVGASEAERLDRFSAFVGALALSPGGLHTGFHVATRIGSAAFEINDIQQGTFCPTGVLDSALGITATSATLELEGLDLTDDVVGEAALIDDEIVRIDAINHATGVITIARGCMDTVPAAHAAGALVWFYGGEASFGYNRTEYAAGATVNIKLLTRTTSGAVLPEGSATTHTLSLTGRQGRPYPPGAFKINGQAYPATISGALTVSWAHRDRVLQSDLLVDTLAGSIGPEPGTTYCIRIHDAGGTVLTEATGLTGTSWTWLTNPHVYDLALLHFDGDITDAAGTTWTNNGGSLVFDVGRFGSCVALDCGAGRFLLATKTYAVSNADWTVECWVKPDRMLISYSSNIFRAGNGMGGAMVALSTNGRIMVGINNGLQTAMSANGVWSADGSWHHVALVRSGATLAAYFDGQPVVSLNVGSLFELVTGLVYLGSSIGEGFVLLLDEFRWSMGARYTAAFTPPTAPFDYTTLPPSAGQLTVTLESVRDGLTSHQRHEWPVTLT